MGQSTVFIKNSRYKILLLLATLLLASCSTTKTAIKKDVDINLNPEHGYVLIGLNTNQILEYMILDGPSKIALTQEDLQPNTEYILTTVPAGVYQITEIATIRYKLSEFDQNKWSFEVKPGRISYIGDLQFEQQSFFSNRFYMSMDNRATAALEFLQQNFPNILESRQLHYSGPGDDKFLDFFYQYQKQQQETNTNSSSQTNMEVTP